MYISDKLEKVYLKQIEIPPAQNRENVEKQLENQIQNQPNQQENQFLPRENG